MEIRQRRRVIAVFVNNQHDNKRRGQYFDTKLTENTFLSVKKTVTGILRELLRQKLSALNASSAVRVCQLLCTAPLETFQMQVLTNNLGYR